MDMLRFLMLIAIVMQFLVGCGGGSSTEEKPINSASSVPEISSQSSSISSSLGLSSSSVNSSVAFHPIFPIPDDLWQPTSNQIPQLGNYIYIESDVDDPIGKGETYVFTYANASFYASNDLRLRNIEISATGIISAMGNFHIMDSILMPSKGYYTDTYNYFLTQNHERASFGFWFGGNVCDKNAGSWFAIDDIRFSIYGKLLSIDLRFEQKCVGHAGSMRGKIHWEATDAALPIAPENPIPASLWSPLLSSEIEENNYLYIEYTPSAIGAPKETSLSTSADASFFLDRLATGVNIEINKKTEPFYAFNARFKQGSKYKIKEISSGYYLKKYHYEDFLQNSFDISFSGFVSVFYDDCDPYGGWFTVDYVEFSDGHPIKIDIRFEMECKGILNGKIHIVNNDEAIDTEEPGSIPSDLWMPSVNDAPNSDNYIYLESELGDYVGAGKNYLYTQKNSQIDLVNSNTRLQFYINGDEEWSADIKTLKNQIKFEKGYYSFISDFSNVTLFDWWGEGRGCNTSNGWFVVDDVEYDSYENLTVIDIRFAQYCEKGTQALYGKIHWRSDDTSISPGPEYPIPDNLWKPDNSVIFPDSNYVYIESDEGDFVGDGKSYMFTPKNAKIDIHDKLIGSLSIDIHGELISGGHFKGMNYLMLLQPGVYRLDRGGNLSIGGMYWGLDGRGCNDYTGWFAIDDISYDIWGSLTSIDYRFEHHCEGALPALRGKVHWRFDDTTLPSEPIFPIPAGLWKPSVGSTPSLGNYLYLDGSAGGWVAAGKTYLFKDIDVNHVKFDIGSWEVIASKFGDPHYGLHIKGTYNQDVLARGLYDNLYNDNPALGNVEVSGDGRACRNLNGWLAVDEVSYRFPEELIKIKARFKQQCEIDGPALYGEINWIK